MADSGGEFAVGVTPPSVLVARSSPGEVLIEGHRGQVISLTLTCRAPVVVSPLVRKLARDNGPEIIGTVHMG
jgi:hypothetical protein